MVWVFRMTHVELIELITFTDPSLDKSKRESVAQHLNICPECRAKLISFNIFKNSFVKLTHRFDTFQLTESCVPEGLMGSCLAGQLSQLEFEKFSNHIIECDICFERAAFFSESENNMTEAVPHMDKTPERFLRAVVPSKKNLQPSQARPTPSISRTIWGWISSPVHAYAVAVSMLVLIFILAPNNTNRILDLNSANEFIIYKSPTTPRLSFGFSDASQKVGSQAAGLVVVAKPNNKVHFSWNTLEKADEYQFILQEINTSGPKKIYDIKTPSSFVEIDLNSITPGKAYRWIVTGSIGAGKLFATKGQFTLTN
tara:strand:- start:15929 stop:16867 length:939 start_codon:yes stop_codon:yes gene_type:complete